MKITLTSRWTPVLFALLILYCQQADSQRRRLSNASNVQTPISVTMDSLLLQAMKYRSIGPFRGGRVTAVAGVNSDIQTYFMGTTGGGVWRTNDGGITWENLSDGFFRSSSIGAIASADSRGNRLYVGSGSGCPRGNISIGDGVYRSYDGGESWEHIGLQNAGMIPKIVVHPSNPDVLYVAALGNPFGNNSERGVFKSEDGGITWTHSFYLNDSTGAVDLVMHPTNPRILYAGMWRVQRKPWTLIDGSTESGLYKSSDAGKTWIRVGGGLPTGLGGRVGVAISPANPDRIWMIQEMKDDSKAGIYRSDDGGKSWERVNREHNLRQRAWYYNHIYADPQDENTVYVLNTGFYKSVDAGNRFQRIQVPHGDNHSLWINPENSKIMIQSNDGGANVSYNRGASWSSQLNQPTAEFYRVTVDQQHPYRVYGAQQDNSTLSISSDPFRDVHPKQHWYSVAGGESGHIAIHPNDPNIVFAGNYIGRIDRIDLDSRHSKNITAYPQMHDGVAPRDIRYRFQWNAPIRISPHNPDILYHCSQYVHRSTDQGQTWEVISPDLTTNKDEYQDLPGGPIQHDHTGVELYTTIFSFEESPYERGVLWVGTDDGRVHVSRDAGTSWVEVTPMAMPDEGTVNSIDISPHVKGRVHISVYKYRDNDFKPYIFGTEDYGNTWQLLTTGSNGIPSHHFTRVVREDPVRAGLLYAGTEFGMYVSFDGGVSWRPFQQNLPITPITDLAIHRGDLIVATQGRSFWIMDDLGPLRQIQANDSGRDLFWIKPAAATMKSTRGLSGDGEPESRPRGAILDYYLNEFDDDLDTLNLRIYNEDDEVLKVYSSHPEEGQFSIQPEKGMNRHIWDLTSTAPVLNPGSYFSLSYTGAPNVGPGTYALILEKGERRDTAILEVRKNPAWTHVSEDDLKEQVKVTTDVLEMLNASHRYIKTLREVRDQVESIVERHAVGDHGESLKELSAPILEKLKEIEGDLIQTRNESGQDPINYPPKLDDQIAFLYTTVNSQYSKPTEGIYERRKDLRQELNSTKARIEALLNSEVRNFEKYLSNNNLPYIHIQDLE